RSAWPAPTSPRPDEEGAPVPRKIPLLPDDLVDAEIPDGVTLVYDRATQRWLPRPPDSGTSEAEVRAITEQVIAEEPTVFNAAVNAVDQAIIDQGGITDPVIAAAVVGSGTETRTALDTSYATTAAGVDIRILGAV